VNGAGGRRLKLHGSGRRPRHRLDLLRLCCRRSPSPRVVAETHRGIDAIRDGGVAGVTPRARSGGGRHGHAVSDGTGPPLRAEMEVFYDAEDVVF
jgi:hypothetical protein